MFRKVLQRACNMNVQNLINDLPHIRNNNAIKQMFNTFSSIAEHTSTVIHKAMFGYVITSSNFVVKVQPKVNMQIRSVNFPIAIPKRV